MAGRTARGARGDKYREADGNHWIVNERHKYIWFSQTGEEHLFDVVEDPNEERDLAPEADLGSVARAVGGGAGGSAGRGFSEGRWRWLLGSRMGGLFRAERERGEGRGG